MTSSVQHGSQGLVHPKPSPQEGNSDVDAQVDDTANDSEAFAAVQAAKASEAMSLLNEEDTGPVPDLHITAPYDASDAEIDDLLTEEHEVFTHIDEVEVKDVAAFDDPYLSATIEGDVPEMVVFDDEEKGPSV